MTFIQTISENPQYFLPIVIWSLIWKGISLWKCGRNNQIRWFLALLVINTLGILEIVYIVWFQKDLNSKK